jgi:hypothetical protein
VISVPPWLIFIPYGWATGPRDTQGDVRWPSSARLTLSV